MSILTMDYLKQELNCYQDPKNKAFRMTKEKKLIRIKRGLYVDAENTSLESLASVISAPSYLSFQYALSYYGIIPERVYELTSATTQKNKKKVFKTELGRFSYRDIPKNVFWYGQVLQQTEEGIIWIASREKAVCDMLSTLPEQKSLKSWKQLLFDDMRFDEDIIHDLNLLEIRFYSRRYRSSNIRFLEKYLCGLPENENIGKEMIIIPDTKIEAMLAAYDTSTVPKRTAAMKEVLQELVLFGLSKTDFFSKAAFYGGTALRIFYGLDRFSEDLDFSLLKPDPQFSFEPYLSVIESTMAEFGMHMETSIKKKSLLSDVQSAFVKGNTRELTLSFFPKASINSLHRDEVLKIKFEADIAPPKGAEYESKVRMLPVTHRVLLYNLPSLFAGKIHAVLCRSWKNRIKGRDLYDYLFYLKKGVPVNLENLNEKLRQSGYLVPDEADLDLNHLKAKLKDHFKLIDYETAKADVIPFLHSQESLNELDFWDSEFFIQTLDLIQSS